MIISSAQGHSALPGTASARWCRFTRTLRTLLVHVVLLVGLARNTVSMVLRAVIVCWLVIQKVYNPPVSSCSSATAASDTDPVLFIGKGQRLLQDFNGVRTSVTTLLNTVRFGSVLCSASSSAWFHADNRTDSCVHAGSTRNHQH